MNKSCEQLYSHRGAYQRWLMRDCVAQAHGRNSTGGPDIKHLTRRLVSPGAGTVVRSTRWHDDGSQHTATAAAGNRETNESSYGIQRRDREGRGEGLKGTRRRMSRCHGRARVRIGACVMNECVRRGRVGNLHFTVQSGVSPHGPKSRARQARGSPSRAPHARRGGPTRAASCSPRPSAQLAARGTARMAGRIRTVLSTSARPAYKPAPPPTRPPQWPTLSPAKTASAPLASAPSASAPSASAPSRRHRGVASLRAARQLRLVAHDERLHCPRQPATHRIRRRGSA